MEKLQQTLNALVESNQALTIKMDKIYSLSTTIDHLTLSMESIENKLEKSTAELHDHAVKLDKQEMCIQTIENKLQDALDEIDRLENRARRHNLRVLNIPENSEVGNMVTFLANTLSSLLQIQLQPIDIEVAHRIGKPLNLQSNKPWVVIFKLHHFQKKLDILGAAAKTKELKFRDQYITSRITSDVSNRQRTMRGEFWALRQQLQEKGLKQRFGIQQYYGYELTANPTSLIM